MGFCTLGKWVRAVSEEAKVPAQDGELLREEERLREENRILREEREGHHLCLDARGWVYLAVRALNMAIAIRRPPLGCIHHTDRGSQYCAHDYQKLLRKHGFKVSTSGKGNCYDNSAVESFFKLLKAKLVWRRNWQTHRVVEVALFEYIDGFYNPGRKHSALGWKSTLAFEQWAA